MPNNLLRQLLSSKQETISEPQNCQSTRVSHVTISESQGQPPISGENQFDTIDTSSTSMDTQFQSSDVCLVPTREQDADVTQNWLSSGENWQPSDLDFDSMMLQGQEELGLGAMTMDELTDQLLRDSNAPENAEVWNPELSEPSQESATSQQFDQELNISPVSCDRNQQILRQTSPGTVTQCHYDQAVPNIHSPCSMSSSTPHVSSPQSTQQAPASNVFLKPTPVNSYRTYQHQLSVPEDQMSEYNSMTPGRGLNRYHSVDAYTHWSSGNTGMDTRYMDDSEPTLIAEQRIVPQYQQLFSASQSNNSTRPLHHNKPTHSFQTQPSLVPNLTKQAEMVNILPPHVITQRLSQTPQSMCYVDIPPASQSDTGVGMHSPQSVISHHSASHCPVSPQHYPSPTPSDQISPHSHPLQQYTDGTSNSVNQGFNTLWTGGIKQQPISAGSYLITTTQSANQQLTSLLPSMAVGQSHQHTPNSTGQYFSGPTTNQHNSMLYVSSASSMVNLVTSSPQAVQSEDAYYAGSNEFRDRRQNTELILKNCGLYDATILTGQLVRRSKEIDDGLDDFKNQIELLVQSINATSM